MVLGGAHAASKPFLLKSQHRSHIRKIHEDRRGENRQKAIQPKERLSLRETAVVGVEQYVGFLKAGGACDRSREDTRDHRSFAIALGSHRLIARGTYPINRAEASMRRAKSMMNRHRIVFFIA